ncbi:DUF5988 family protein [Amycolatopsis cihanbeyliensis]|uniref:Uncharacterized protein n=1 Tax=Amycolatopsis cihanbeyliensis TaxID=1128664 RepID=A0A542DS88_AMYCI|nr:DUF5988 family protein [Amycolatopsis cihanbeyliensis]TQJ05855.1 hypothetical protein FB471_5699 [Amycolatopsis cihanbeyliensis]
MPGIKAELVGGPATLSEVDRRREVVDLGEQVKINTGAGYEHFSHNGQFDTVSGEKVAVFAWTGRTRVAE